MGIDNTEVTDDNLVEMYVALRDEIKTMKAAHEASVKPLQNKLNAIGSVLDQRLERRGAKSSKTDHGTASRVITSIPVCKDWEALNEWALENQRLDLFPRKLNAGPIKEMDELPPGVQLQETSRIQVRKG